MTVIAGCLNTTAPVQSLGDMYTVPASIARFFGTKGRLWQTGAGCTRMKMGSVIATSDSAGNSSPTNMDPMESLQNWNGSRFKYTGQIAMPEAQLYHYKSRVYDPNIGDSSKRTPLAARTNLNLYAYAG